LKYYYRILKGQELWIRPQMKENHKWFGSDSCGFFVCPDIMKQSGIVYSFGVEDISFDIEIIKHFDCKVYAFDPTPRAIKFIERQGEIDKFNFHPIAIHHEDGYVNFFVPLNPDQISGHIHDEGNDYKSIRVEGKKFSTIAKEFGHRAIDLIKMDIEGSEYDIIDDILESDVVIPQILMEVHTRFKGNGVAKTKNLIKKMNTAGYKIAAISPSGIELTFVKTK
jgi:FkbM family methyltransferase